MVLSILLLMMSCRVFSGSIFVSLVEVLLRAHFITLILNNLSAVGFQVTDDTRLRKVNSYRLFNKLALSREAKLNQCNVTEDGSLSELQNLLNLILVKTSLAEQLLDSVLKNCLSFIYSKA